MGELCRPSSHVSMDVIIISRWSPLRVQDECQMTVEGNTASMTSDELIFGKSRRPGRAREGRQVCKDLALLLL